MTQFSTGVLPDCNSNNCIIEFHDFSSYSVPHPCFISFRVSSTIVNGTTYVKGEVVVCGVEQDTPMFGRINEFLVTPNLECLFVISPLLTVCFRHHFHAYEVVSTQDTYFSPCTAA